MSEAAGSAVGSAVNAVRSRAATTAEGQQLVDSANVPPPSDLRTYREPGEWPLVKNLEGGDKDNMNVLLLGIDGCRPDVLLMHASRLKAVMLKGASAMACTCPYPALSGPGWATILTGTLPTHHGILDNQFTSFLDGSKKVNSFFDDEGTNGGIFTAWKELGEFAQGENQRIPYKPSHEHHAFGASKCDCGVKFKYLYNGFTEKPMGFSNDEVIKDAVEFINEKIDAEKRNFCFVHLDDLDHVGHFSGYGPYVKPYVDAMIETDAQFGQLFDAIDERVQNGEHWRIVVLTDHGGSAQRFLSPVQKQAFRIKNRNMVAPCYQTSWTKIEDDIESSSYTVQACLTEATSGVHGLPLVQDKTSFVMVYDSNPKLVEAGEIYPEPQFFDIPYYCGYDDHLLEMLDDNDDGKIHPGELQRQTKLLYEVARYFS